MLFRWPSAAVARAGLITLVSAAALAAAAVPAASQQDAEAPPAASPDATIPNAGAPALAPEEGSAVARLIAANIGSLKSITPELIALISADPALAAGLIEAAKSSPAQATALAQILSTIQTQLRGTNPDGAKVVAALVMSAPPEFQAAYAVAQADAGGGGGNAGDGGGSAASTGGGGGGAPGTGGGGPAGGGATGGGGTGSGGLGFGSSFGGAIGGGGGSSGGGSSGSGGGANAPAIPVFTQNVAGWLADNGFTSADYTDAELASWQAGAQWLAEQLPNYGLNPLTMNSGELDKYYASALVLAELGSYTTATSDQLAGYLRLASLTSAPLTPNQLSGFLSLVGVTLPRPLNQMTLGDIQQALLMDADMYFTIAELQQMLTEAGFDLSHFAGSCTGIVSPSTPCG